MSFKKTSGLVATILTCTAPVLFAGNVAALSLDEALIKAYSSNPTLKAERSAAESVNEQLPQSYSEFLPSLFAGYNKSVTNEKFASGAKNTSRPATKSLTLSQPIFDGFNSWYGIKLAKDNIKVAEHNLISIEQRVLTQAVIAYIDVARTKKILELSKENESVLAEQLQATNDRFDLGETTRTDVSQSETRLARAESDRIKSHGEFIKAKANFKKIIGADISDDIKMPDTLPEIPSSFEEVLGKALSQNPALKIAEYRVSARKNNVRKSKSTLLPQVSLNGSINRQTGLSNTRLSTEIDTDTVTVDVTVPLYQSGAEYSRIRQAKTDFQNADHRLKEARDQVISDTTDAWQQVITTRADTKANVTAVKAAKLALEGVKEEQEVGSRDTLDVLNAEQELFITQVNLVTAIRNSVIAIYNVQASMGELTAKSLNLEVDFYNPTQHLNDVKYKFIGF